MNESSRVLTLAIGPRPLAESVGEGDVASVRFVAVPTRAIIPAVRWPGSCHTLRLDWTSDGETIVQSGTREVGVPWNSLFDGLLPSAGLAEGTGQTVAPLWLFVRDESGVHVFVALRHGLRDALFVRLHREAISDRPLVDLCRFARTLQREHSVFLNNHQCYYRRYFPGEEVEHKYTLGTDTDIWGVALRLYEVVRRGDMPGFIPEYGDEFQAWDYLNHLFAVPEPPKDKGYVSFIPLSTGGYTIKRKWFDHDATRRGEVHIHAPAGLTDLDRHVRTTMGLTAAERMPSFRRVRYDLNLESLRTGHVYGIFFDRSVTLGDTHARLVQCELEYIRTRSVLRIEDDEILEELECVAQWLEAFLEREGLSSTRGVYSKLSFLRDAVAGRLPAAPEELS